MARTQNISGNGGPTRVAFYTRISTDEDHQKYSLGAQSERLEAFCKAQYGDDWRLHKLYRDTESGTHMHRPGLEEMLYDAGARAFDTLLVFRVDRLSRKVRELAQMVDELTKNGIALKSITEPFDTANAAGKMMLQMLGVFAEFEHATIVERTKVRMEKKAKGGKFVGGNVPYGYALHPEKGLIINEEEALIVRKMFQMYTFGREGSSAICKQLNEAGHRNRNGRKWGRRIVLHMLKNPVYVGKIRWREVTYEGHHDPVVSGILFEKAQEILQERHEESKGRQFHNTDERLLTGIMKCARCDSHMFGASGTKNGVRQPYYVCSKRFNDHDCEQDYVRAERLEAAIIEDIKSIFRDEQFMARLWEEANKLLRAEKPDLEKEIARIDSQMAKAQASIDRYFEAFEAGTLKAELCNEKVAGLQARVQEMKAEKQELDARRERLELPAIDKEMLASILANFEKVMAEGPNAKKKHLLHRMVKKVLIHSRQTIEIWYMLPNSQRFADSNIWLPSCNTTRTRQGPAELEVWFQIVYLAQVGQNRPLFAPYREQTVEVALGSNGVFERGTVGLELRAPPGQVAKLARPGKPAKEPKTPRVVELLRKAIEWQALLESGKDISQAVIARQEGITRARVTQIMGMLRLAPTIQRHILSLPDVGTPSPITERALRPIGTILNQRNQVREFHKFMT